MTGLYDVFFAIYSGLNKPLVNPQIKLSKGKMLATAFVSKMGEVDISYFAIDSCSEPCHKMNSTQSDIGRNMIR